MREFKTIVSKNSYRLIFDTDEKEAYEAIQQAARDIIDKKVKCSCPFCGQEHKVTKSEYNITQILCKKCGRCFSYE
jgi:transposase-like protein